jgi:O-antigen ligase
LQPVHNIFLLVLVESGLIGLIGFLMFLFGPILLHKPSNLLTKSQGVGLLLIIIFLGMVDHYFLTLPQGQRVLFLVWGLLLARK